MAGRVVTVRSLPGPLSPTRTSLAARAALLLEPFYHKMDVASVNLVAAVARSHEGTPSAKKLEADFSEFNKKRAEEKLLLYERVFSVGLRLLVVGLVLALIVIFFADFVGLCVTTCRNGPKLVAANVVLFACFITFVTRKI